MQPLFREDRRMIRQGILLVFLVIHTVLDIRSHMVPVWSAMGFLAGGAAVALIGGESPLTLAAGMIPGAAMLLTGKLSGEAVGYGDGLAVLVTGCCLGLRETCGAVLSGLVLSAGWSILLMVTGKAGMKNEIPWIPFLLLGCVGKIVTGL